MTTVKEYLRWAAGQVGVQESPRGSNRTPYAGPAGHAQGLPWCATFLVAGAKLTGLALPPGADTASTAVDEAAFKRAGRLTVSPRVGDWAFVYFPSLNRVAHVAVVYGLDGGYVLTIEGNSNDEGSREGYEVCRRRRPIHRPSGAVGIRSFGRPLYTTPPPVPVPTTRTEHTNMVLAKTPDGRWWLVGVEGKRLLTDAAVAEWRRFGLREAGLSSRTLDPLPTLHS